MNRHAVRRLVNACTYKLMHDFGPIMETMRMQVMSGVYISLETNHEIKEKDENTTSVAKFNF